MYSIIKVTNYYRKSCKVYKEHTVTDTASREEVDRILSGPESYDGERAEALEDLATTGITSYLGYMIIEH